LLCSAKHTDGVINWPNTAARLSWLITQHHQLNSPTLSKRSRCCCVEHPEQLHLHGQCAKLKLEGQPAVVPSGERPAVLGLGSSMPMDFSVN
jgi:hypothetical protein